ncbi:MAG: peptidylprolyl isomerase [Blastopirellula sp.]|nr:MAG: peptidylprolyl isomerase [Blastopirellula sp.]
MTWKTWGILTTGFALLVTGIYIARQEQGPPEAEAQAPLAQRPIAPTTVQPRVADTSKNIRDVAVVNRVTITRDQLGAEALLRHGEEVLESQVNKHLILQACQKYGIKITDGHLDAEIAKIAKKFNLPVDRWYAMLQEERNVTPSRYRRDIIWPTLALRALAADRLKVSDEEVQNAWEANYGPKVKVRMISVKDRGLAEELRVKAVNAPETFSNLAKEHSQDQNSASANGLIPPVRRHVGMKEIEEAVFNLKEGEISHVIFVAEQYLIFKCEAHLPATVISPQDVPAIQGRLVDKIRDNKMRDSAGDIFKELQQQAEIVNVFNDPIRSKQMPGVAVVINGRQISTLELQEECIVRFGLEVLEGEINRTVLTQALETRQILVTEADLDAEIKRAAYSFGFLLDDGKTPDLEGWLEKVTTDQGVSVELYVRDAVWPTVALKKLVQDRVKITDEDLRKGYEANYGERAQILAIVLDTQRRAQEVWDMARRNPTEKFFGELSAQYSIEPVSKNNDGQVPPLRRFGGQPALEEEAFRLQHGELSGIVAVGKQFIILRSLGKTKSTIDSIEDVREELTRDIMEKKIRVEMSKEFELIRQDAQIHNYLANTSQSGKTSRSVAGKPFVIPSTLK